MFFCIPFRLSQILRPKRFWLVAETEWRFTGHQSSFGVEAKGRPVKLMPFCVRREKLHIILKLHVIPVNRITSFASL